MAALLHIKTPDGVQPVERFGPQGDTAVIVYMDGFGIRDELREMCRRFADMGHTVYLPNMYYRHGGPSFPPPNSKGVLSSEMAREMNGATSVEMSVSDSRALIASEPATRWAVIGYCMGGRHAIAAAAAYPDQIKVAMSLHGGHMIFDSEWSCEKLIPETTAEIFLGFAKDDPSCPERDKDILRAALSQAAAPGEAVDFDAAHGWSFPSRHCFDIDASEAVWTIAQDILTRNLTDQS